MASNDLKLIYSNTGSSGIRSQDFRHIESSAGQKRKRITVNLYNPIFVLHWLVCPLHLVFIVSLTFDITEVTQQRCPVA